MEEAIEDFVSSSAITAPLLVAVSEETSSVSVGAAAKKFVVKFGAVRLIFLFYNFFYFS